MLKLGWPSTTVLALYSDTQISDTTGEQAGTPELIDADPKHWQLISDRNDHEETVIDMLVDFAEYAIETTDLLNESVAKEIEDKATRAKAWREERTNWLKEQSEALKGKGHGKNENEDEQTGKAHKGRGKSKGKGTKKEKDDMEVDEGGGADGWGPWPKDAQAKSNRAEGSGTGAGKGKGKAKHTCEHCGKWGSHKAEDCRDNPDNQGGASSKGHPQQPSHPPEGKEGKKKKGKGKDRR
jgi:hypothetical protein